MSNSSQYHELQHARLSCPSLSPRVSSNSCPLSWWCYPIITLRHLLFLLPSIYPSFNVFSNESVLCISWPKYWSFSFSNSPSNEYLGLISLRLTGLIFLLSKGLSRAFMWHKLGCPGASMVTYLREGISGFCVVGREEKERKWGRGSWVAQGLSDHWILWN